MDNPDTPDVFDSEDDYIFDLIPEEHLIHRSAVNDNSNSSNSDQLTKQNVQQSSASNVQANDGAIGLHSSKRKENGEELVEKDGNKKQKTADYEDSFLNSDDDDIFNDEDKPVETATVIPNPEDIPKDVKFKLSSGKDITIKNLDIALKIFKDIEKETL